MQFKSHLDDARRTSEADFQRVLKATARQSSPLQLLTNNPTANARIQSSSRQRVFDAREQYAHFRGQVHTSVRPIAHRIAGQPIRLAIVAPKNQTRAQKALGETAFATLGSRYFESPKWVKNLTLKADEEIRLVQSHAVLDALNHPAPEMPAFTDWLLKCSLVLSLEITGAAYLWVRKVGGKSEIWPLPTHWVRPIHTEQNLFVGWNLLPDGCETDIDLERDEIVPFALPDPSDPMKVLGPLEAGAREILVNEFVTEAQKRLFQLGPHPSAIIRAGSAKTNDGKPVPPRLRNWQIEQVKAAIQSRYQGLAHYGEPFIADRLIESIDPWGNKPHEMSFGENSGTSRERVEQIFGVSAYVVGASGMGSRAESAESDAHFCYTTCSPLVELISRVMTTVLLPLFDKSGRYVLFIEPPRPRDTEMEQKAWTDLLQGGGATINMFLSSVLKHPPVPWGDAVLLKTGMALVPVDQLKDGFTNAHTGPQSAEVGQSDPALDQKPQNPEAANAQEAEGEEPQKAIALSKAADDFADQYAETWLKTHGKNEQSLSDAVEKFLKQQGEAVAAKLESLGGDEQHPDALVSKLFDADAADKAFRKAVAEPFAKAVADGASHEWNAFSSKSKDADIGFSYDFGRDLPPHLLEAVKSAVDTALAMPYWSEIQQTTRDALTQALKDSIEAGESPAARLKRIKDDVFQGDVSKERAQAIARTESTHAMSAGQDAARQELAADDIVTGKEWQATYDGLTRGTHLSANGQRVGVNETFTVGGYPAKYPGDPNLPAKQRVNCRCNAASVTVFTDKRTRPPRVKAMHCQHCEIHGHH